MKLKRKLLWFGGGLAALVVVGAVASEFILGAAVTAGVNRFGPSFTGTTVSLGGARLSPIFGTGTLNEFLVGNPAGWSGDRAIYFKRIHVDVAPASLLGDHIVVNEISIDGPEFVYQTKFVSSNIGDLLKSIEGTSSSAAAAREAEAKAPVQAASNPLRFEIKRFRLTHGIVKIGIGAATLPLPMPPISLDNLGTAEGGIAPDQIVTAVMRSVVGGVVETTTQAAGKIGSTLGAAAGSGAHDAVDALKGLFGGKKN